MPSLSASQSAVRVNGGGAVGRLLAVTALAGLLGVVASCNSAPAASAHSAEALAFARAAMVERLPQLTADEQHAIQQRAPTQIGYYEVGAGAGQWKMVWRLPTGREARISFEFFGKYRGKVEAVTIEICLGHEVTREWGALARGAIR